jgi:NADH-quinone oxidoreductase subunit M
MPIYAGMTTFAFFASMGLPGLSGFISEILVFLGGFKVYTAFTIASVSGVVLTAGYFLWAMQRMFLGPLNEKYKDLPEINFREMFTLIPLGLIVLLVGVYPMSVISLINKSVEYVITIIK